ncbi:MAG TPA: hypothetical protein VF752_02555 [Thermoleophilaceae bacterium]
MVLAISTLGVIVLVVAVVLVGAVVMAVVFRGSKREPQVEHEQEVVLEEQFGSGEPVDWQGDLKPPRDPY